MASRIEQALARASLRPSPYTDEEVQAAEARLAARVTRRMLSGALSFDDEVRCVRAEQPPVPYRRPVRPVGCRALGVPGWSAEAGRNLATLCRTVIEREGALQHMSAFLGQRILHPEGARVLACVLQLAGREDSARFWWQFAAGAGDRAAAYCLYLHHLTLGEVWEAELWRKQAAPGLWPSAGSSAGGGETTGAPPPGGETEDGSSPGLVLRVLERLRGECDYLTAAATAVIHYVPEAVHFVDEIELPLPSTDFARRIEELTATA